MEDRMRVVSAAVVAMLLAASAAYAEPLACQRAIAKAGVLFTRATTKALTKCELAKRAGKLPPDIACAADLPTTVTIGRAEEKLRSAVAKACGGKNAVCDAADLGADADDPLAA